MGKHSKYHPVSLHVIRGAVEYCGWKFGKISQTSQDAVGGSAKYLCVIERIPPKMRDENPYTWHKTLQLCFAEDVTILEVTSSSTGRRTCSLEASIVPRARQEQFMELNAPHAG